MNAGGFRQLPVVDDGSLMGMVTDSELRHRGRYLESTLVEAAMSCCPVVITPADLVEVAAIPVVENCQTVGIVTASDLLKALLDIVEAAK